MIAPVRVLPVADPGRREGFIKVTWLPGAPDQDARTPLAGGRGKLPKAPAWAKARGSALDSGDLGRFAAAARALGWTVEDARGTRQ